MERNIPYGKIILCRIIYSTAIKEEVKGKADILNEKINSLTTMKSDRFISFSVQLKDELFHPDCIHLKNEGLRAIRGIQTNHNYFN
jgi:hypothetical protein